MSSRAGATRFREEGVMPVSRGPAMDSEVDRLPHAGFVIVAGVSGAGKSTIAALLAARLGWTYQDGDWLHPPANVVKMRGGRALTDEDRCPWLSAIRDWINEARSRGESAVIACSALKRAYRDYLLAG
jgi:gluconokinase